VKIIINNQVIYPVKALYPSKKATNRDEKTGERSWIMARSSGTDRNYSFRRRYQLAHFCTCDTIGKWVRYLTPFYRIFSKAAR